METRTIVGAALALASVVVMSAREAGAAVVVLDETNNYTATIAPGVSLSQPGLLGSSAWVGFTGAVFALGTPDVADFSVSFSQIGLTGNLLGNDRGMGPASFVRNLIDFTIRDEQTGDLFAAVMTYFDGQSQGPVGVYPGGRAPRAAFEIWAVPEPSAAALVGLGLLTCCYRRRH